MAQLKKKFDIALSRFVEKHKKNDNVIGILVSGSYIHSKPDKNSDLDVFVVLRDSMMRERGNTWIEGIEVEYFMNPVKQIRHYFKTEVGDKAPCTAHMFANSIILYDKGDIVNSLISEAKKIIKAPTKKLTSMQIELAKYFIDDMEKDLEDTYMKRDKFAFNQVANKLLDRSLKIFMQVKRVHREKSKRLFEQLNQLDKRFARLYHDSMVERDIEKRYDIIRELIRYIEHNLGGKRSKEWRLRSKCIC